MSGAIKINSEKIKQIKKGDQGLRFNQGFIWVQLGDRYTTGCKLGISNIHTQNQRRERVPRVSTSLGHLSMSVPRVSTSLVHLTHVGPTCLTSGSHLCHMPVPHWSTSPSPCHMAKHSLTQSDLPETHGSTSLVHITGHITTSATWQPVNGPHQQGKCQMAQSQEATSTCLCHMALYYRATSVTINQIISVKGGILN
jgi:hypothetical protein